MTIKNKKKIIVVCRDAGGAEIISAYVKTRKSKIRFYCYVTGPAVKVFSKKQINFEKINKKNTPVKVLSKHRNVSVLLTGLGWSSSLELRFIKLAKVKKIKTAVYLDHWVNYRERFGYPRKNWLNYLSDEIWVGDKEAFKLAQICFAKYTIVKFVPNQYFKELKREYREKNSTNNKRMNILFLCEPISQPANSFGDTTSLKYDERDILKMFLDGLLKVGFKGIINVRLHPSESQNKYKYIIDKFAGKLKIIMDKADVGLSLSLQNVDMVVGMDTAAMAAAVVCGKKVVSFIPDLNYKRSLPFNEIIRANDKKSLISVFRRFMHNALLI